MAAWWICVWHTHKMSTLRKLIRNFLFVCRMFKPHIVWLSFCYVYTLVCCTKGTWTWHQRKRTLWYWFNEREQGNTVESFLSWPLTPQPSLLYMNCPVHRLCSEDNLISSLNISESTGPNGISTRMLNMKVCCCIYHSLPQCTRLFNLSFISTGFLPDSWKTASIATSYPMQNQPRISRPLLITGQLERLVHAQAHVLVCSWQPCHTIDMDILVPLPSMCNQWPERWYFLPIRSFETNSKWSWMGVHYP